MSEQVSAAEHEHAEVWQEDSGHWRWAWFAPDRPDALVSTYQFGSAEEATEDAREAYPLAVVRIRPDSEPHRTRRTVSRWLVVGGVAAGLGAFSGWRRSRREDPERA